ncbi:Ppx/GppA family phosphatase [Actinomadura sp. NPDC047616]|uniref:Ppx/GppA phosphatase family protein n=1 Tax=Actinomadura sp. NPDC047616 TaxID=3155914 RepID=UPI0033EE3677
MRLGVLDVGSNSAHLKVVEVDVGRPHRTVATVKHPTRLAEATGADGTVEPAAIGRLTEAIRGSIGAAARHDVDELIAFATSAVRDAANRDEIVARVTASTGLRLGFLTGRDEARLTFLAARAWYGWSAGGLLLADIGGGSLEIAHGDGQEPTTALSLPLGAGRLTREHLPGDPPSPKRVRRLRRLVRRRLTEATGELAARLAARRDDPQPMRPLATSRTFTQLARLTGAPKHKAGPYARRVLDRERLRAQIPVLARTDYAGRAKLPGISRARAPQILAGAIVAEAVMTIFDIEQLEICPWALREGVVIRRLQAMADPADADDETARLTQSILRLPAQRDRSPVVPLHRCSPRPVLSVSHGRSDLV